jgi:hypothetical protein
VARRGKTSVAYVPNGNAALTIRIVGSVLDRVGPQNVDRDSVTVTEEGESVGIVLVPHRDLGGLALVVSLNPRYANLSWAAVFDLYRHDDLDVGKWVLRIQRSDPEWEGKLRSQLMTELARKITVTVRRNWLRRLNLWCTIEVEGRPADICVARLSTIKGLDRAKVVPVGDTSLQGPETPWFSQPVPLVTWHKGGVPAWPSASKRGD